MKTTDIITRTRNSFLTIASAIMIFSFSPCAAQADFLVSSVVPAARGSVTVTKDTYNNYIVNIQIKSLSEAGRLSPPKNTYVIWMITDGNLTKNIGQVRTSTTFLSKNLNASFETKSSFRPVKIFLTAEYDPNLETPGNILVLTTDVFNLPKE